MTEVTLFRDHPREGWRSMDRYAAELATHLEMTRPDGWQVSMPLPPDPGGNVYMRLANRTVRYPKWARRVHADISHVLDHSYGHLVSGLDPDRTVVTVHDLAPIHFPGRRLGISGLIWRRALHHALVARHVIVGSHFVAGELAAWVDGSRTAIHVVPHGVDPIFTPRPDGSTGTEARSDRREGPSIVLHVGRIHPRKNVPVVLEAVAELRSHGRDVRLVQVGGYPDAACTERLRSLGLEEAVRFTGPVSDTELVDLYRSADVFVFPSLYEGFGLPVMEAMACGTPVVTSNRTALPEVAGEAALLAEPSDSSAVAAAVARVLDEPGTAELLRTLGLARAQEATWERTARRTWAVYAACADVGADPVDDNGDARSTRIEDT